MRKPHFAPKADPRFPHAQIYLQFTFAKGQLLRYYTGLTVPNEYWDKETERVKKDRKFPEYSELNAQLQRIESEALQIAMRYQYNKDLLTKQQFKKELDAFLGKGESVTRTISFFTYLENFIRERAENPNYAKGSIKVYRTTYNHLKNYAAQVLKRDLEFADFNHAFFSQFTNHLFGLGFSNNYVHKLTSTLRTVPKEG
ncbi:MAG: phage integrase SAM-like domain-containing protein [Saprospiraceae bacterium]